MDPGITGRVIQALDGHSIYEFIRTVLYHSSFAASQARTMLLHEAPNLIQTLLVHPETAQVVEDLVLRTTESILKSEVTQMAAKQRGWHFSASNMSSEAIEAFSIEEMATTLQNKTPRLWALLTTLLVSDASRETRRARYVKAESSFDPSEMSMDLDNPGDGSNGGEDEYWTDNDDGDLEDSDTLQNNDSESEAKPSKSRRRAGSRNFSLHRIVSYLHCDFLHDI